MATLAEITNGKAVPPNADDHEKNFIGALLIDSPKMPDDVREECFTAVADDDIRQPAEREIYATLRRLGGSPDHLQLVGELKRRGVLEHAGDLLEELENHVPTWRHWQVDAAAIRRASDLRRVAALADDLRRAAYDPDAESDDVLLLAEKGTAAIRDRHAAGQVVVMNDAMIEAGAAFHARCESGEPTGLSTPWPDVTAKTELRNGELTFVAGRPGSGKTALTLNVVRHVGGTLNKWVLVNSLEMSRLELCERLISSAAGINLKAIRAGKLDRNDRRRFIEAQAELATLPIHIEDTPRRSLADITATARRLKRQGKLDLVVIDYLALLLPENPRDPRQEQVAKMARGLKCLARELNVPVLCLAQLNREAEKSTDHRPKLSHLRESGAIEQDADVVLFVHREECFAPDDDDVRGKAQLIVAKNRNGETGTVDLAWLASTTSFGSLSKQWKGLD